MRRQNNKPEGAIYPMTKEARRHMDKVNGKENKDVAVWEIILFLIVLTIILFVLAGLPQGVSHL